MLTGNDLLYVGFFRDDAGELGAEVLDIRRRSGQHGLQVGWA